MVGTHILGADAAWAKDMPPALEQLSVTSADSLDDRPLGMVTNDLTVDPQGSHYARRLQGNNWTGKVRRDWGKADPLLNPACQSDNIE
jgi:hypothetical protein